MTVLMPNWYYEKKDLKRSPSVLDGLDNDKESRYRREGARFIINVGTKMGLRYDTMATGVVYFHRFYMFHSFKTFPRYVTACCCLFLAGKVEETPKKCKDIIRTAKTFLTENQFAQFGDDPKEEVMTLERILLQTIKFDLQVDHPYGYLLKYAKSLKGDNKKLQNMVQMAWTFINDSLCTTLCLQWEPEVIAIALMYLAGKLTKFEVVDWIGRISKHAYWWDMFVEGMSIELLEDICHQVLDLYSTPMSNTPQDSPPATPPTKSTRKSSQPPSPIETSTSPAQSKVKEQPPPPPPVGMPIPRLEPGELKRKVSLSESKKEVEGKIPRLEGKAIPIISSSNNSSPPKRHSSVKGFSSQPISPNIPKPIETVTKITKHIDISKHTISLDSTFRSGIASIPNTQPYQQSIPLLPSENITPIKPLQHMPVTPTTTYNITLPPPNATYAQSTASFFTAVASTENPSYSNIQPPPQIFPQQFSHPPPSVAPSPSLTRPPIQYSEQPHQYQALPPGSVPPFNSQYPPPPPSIRPPNIISNSNVVHPPSEVSGINRNAPPPPPPGVPHRNTPPHGGTPRNSGPPPPPPGIPHRSTPRSGTPRSSGPPPPGVTPRNSTPLLPGVGLRNSGPSHDNMYGPRQGSDMYHPHQKGPGLRLPLDRPPGRDYGPRGSYEDSPRMPRYDPEFDPSFQRRPLFPEFDQNFHRPHHPNQFGPNFDGQMPPRRFPHNLHHRSPRPRLMNTMQQQQQGTPTGIPPVRITGRY